MMATEGILAGFDGSRSSARALSWAAREARARAARLTVCHAWSPDGLPPEGHDVWSAMRDRGSDILARGVRLAQEAMGTAAVAPLLVAGPAAAVLREEGSRADMIVLGARGAGSQVPGGGVPGLLAGSVSSQVAAYASVPVVLERGHWRPAGGCLPGPVVAGVDGSPDSRAALRLAFHEAALRSAPVQVICARPDASGALGAGSQLEEDIESLLSAAAKERPEVPVLRQSGTSGPLRALLSAAQDGQLVVIGRRGLGGVRGMRLGSAGRGVLEHAPCPVAVVSHP